MDRRESKTQKPFSNSLAREIRIVVGSKPIWNFVDRWKFLWEAIILGDPVTSQNRCYRNIQVRNQLGVDTGANELTSSWVVYPAARHISVDRCDTRAQFAHNQISTERSP
jgi:hypothetical protein